jgi:tyrosyl-tRNA synthetase
MNIFEELNSRGLIAQCSKPDELSNLLDGEKIRVYCGFDPTSDSLTVGNLLALVTLRRFSLLGHSPIILIGNFTGMIGDPTGRSTERPVLSARDVHINSQKIALQASKIVGNPFQIVFNGSFYEDQNVLTFMRDIGSLFTVNSMMTKDSIQNRLKNGGLTFSEMSYSLFQAADFDFLFNQFGCRLQIGGSDQWGNICAGIELCGKRGHEVFGLTFPLVTKSDGTKFGKSSEGAIWLDSSKTSVWDFFQFWINLPDDNIISLFRMFSLKSEDRMRATIKANAANPSQRIIQRALAFEMTELVHGFTAAERCNNVARGLFSDEWDRLGDSDFELAASISGSIETEGNPINVVELLVNSGLAESKSDANRLIKSNGVTVNGNIVTKPIVEDVFFFNGKFVILKKGKKSVRIVKRKTMDNSKAVAPL